MAELICKLCLDIHTLDNSFYPNGLLCHTILDSLVKKIDRRRTKEGKGGRLRRKHEKRESFQYYQSPLMLLVGHT